MVFIDALIFVVALNLAGFLIAYKLKSDKLTDLSYGLSFLLIATFVYRQHGGSFTSKLFLALSALWALRLASFLLIRIFKMKKDKRFDGVRENFWKFGQFWLFQAITSWIIMVPAIYVISKNPVSFNKASLWGVIIWIIGFLFETISDIQKYKFSNNVANKDRWISEGLWAFSRHPNYFGEITMWIGVYLAAMPYLTNGQTFIALISPLWISYLLIFVTGLPKLEDYADNKWGNISEYKRYKKQTPILVPKIFR